MGICVVEEFAERGEGPLRGASSRDRDGHFTQEDFGDVDIGRASK